MTMSRLGIVLYEVLEFAERVIPYDIVDKSGESQFEGKPRHSLEEIFRPRETEADVNGEEMESLLHGAYHEDQHTSSGETVPDAINQASPFKVALQDYAE